MRIRPKNSNKNEKQNSVNYLDLIPIRNSSIKWHVDHRKRVVLEVENKGWMNRIAQELFNRPRYTKVHLDEMGTFVWPLIDGQRQIADIASLVREEFGEKAEPLYPRVVKYFQIMESYHFVTVRE